MRWVEHINLEKNFVANMISIERDTLDKGDVCDVGRLIIVHVTTVAHGKSVVDGYMQLMDIIVNC